ncbi:methyltransferase domain-containing protein [Brevundimonas diminuta ATCC 11568]
MVNWANFRNIKEYDIKSENCEITASGMSGPESWGRWTDAHNAKLSLPHHAGGDDLGVIIELMGHLHTVSLPSQKVIVSHMGEVLAEWDIVDAWYRLKGLVLPGEKIRDLDRIDLEIQLPDARSPKDLGGADDARTLGVAINRIWTGEVNDLEATSALFAQIGGRYVGTESRKTWDQKHLSGFWKSYITGPNVLDIGFSSYGDARVVPIMEGAIGVDIDYPEYDGRRLPFEDASQDTVYSSHCLEHIPDPLNVIQDWYRVTKVGGHIIIAVPSRDLFERRRRPPSLWNPEHLRMYSCASLLTEIEAALEPNSFKIRHLSENDDLFDYTRPPMVAPYGNFEITVVIEKLRTPEWRLVD